MLVGQGVPDRVGQVDGGRAGLDGGRAHLCHERGIRARRVLARELDLVDPRRDVPDCPARLLEHLGRLQPELALHVDRARREEDVDARPATRSRERLDGCVEVLGARPGERCDRGTAYRLADCANALEVARRGDGEAGLDHVDAEAVERARDLRLLVRRQRDARGLLPIPQRRVENRDPAAIGHFSAPPVRSPEGVPVVCFGRCVRQADRRVSRVLPLVGENQEKLDAEETAGGYAHGCGVCERGYGRTRRHRSRSVRERPRACQVPMW